MLNPFGCTRPRLLLYLYLFFPSSVIPFLPPPSSLPPTPFLCCSSRAMKLTKASFTSSPSVSCPQMACVPRHRSGRTLRPREPGFEQRILGDFNCRGRTQKHIRGRASRRCGLQLRSADPKSVCSAVFGGKVFLSPTPLRGRYLNDAIKGVSRRPAPGKPQFLRFVETSRLAVFTRTK